MTSLGVFMAVLLYLAFVIFVIGLVVKISGYIRAPAPLPIATTPAPLNKRGVGLRFLREIVLFSSLFKSNKWIWLFGWLFHFALLLVSIRHLRYFTEPVWAWVALLQSAGMYAGMVMMFGLAGLWIRRLVNDRMRYISSISDHLMLLLLLAIGGTGLLMKYVWRTDIIALKQFTRGLLVFDFQPLPGDPLLILHLSLVALLMIIFPFSKLLHVPGQFFCPTRYQVDNPRERRHVTSWTGALSERSIEVTK